MKTVVISAVVVWCAWCSQEGYGRKHQESIRERYCDRDPKDVHAGICTKPQEGA